MKPKAIIFDVDGTLADVSSILHFIVKHKSRESEGFKKDFHRFHEESLHVPAHEDVAAWARKEYLWGTHILVVTARREMWRTRTSLWLAKHQIHHQALFMRGDFDYRPDYEVKKEILEEIQKYWTVTEAVDDNPAVIRLWEENGIKTTKIGTWDGQ